MFLSEQLPNTTVTVTELRDPPSVGADRPHKWDSQRGSGQMIVWPILGVCFDPLGANSGGGCTASGPSEAKKGVDPGRSIVGGPAHHDCALRFGIFR
jgi:hypothetical protein